MGELVGHNRYAVQSPGTWLLVEGQYDVREGGDSAKPADCYLGWSEQLDSCLVRLRRSAGLYRI